MNHDVKICMVLTMIYLHVLSIVTILYVVRFFKNPDGASWCIFKVFVDAL